MQSLDLSLSLPPIYSPEEQHHKQDDHRTNHQKTWFKTPIWTQNEHENFVNGMKTYGIGMWKDIADNCVPSKTVAQISTHADDFFRNAIESAKKNGAINAAAISIIKAFVEASSRSKRKLVIDDDNKDDDDVIVLDTVPYIPPRKVRRTLNLFPLVSGECGSSSRNKEAEEVYEQEGEDCSLNLFPTHPGFI